MVISLIETQKETKFWEENFEKAKSARTPFEREWYMNMAFYFGKQYVSWIPTTSPNLSTQRLVEPPAPRYRVRLVANKILPAIRTELTKLTKEEPQFWVKPESSEPKDVAQARVGESLFEYCLDEYDFNKCRRSSTWWALICGTSFWRTSIGDDNMIDYMPVTAFHLYVPNLQEEKIQKQPWVIHARVADPDKIKSHFNLSKLNPSVDSANGTDMESVLKNTLNIKNQDGQKQCYIKEIWIRPNMLSKYPNGALITIVDGQMIDQQSSLSEDDVADAPIDSPNDAGGLSELMGLEEPEDPGFPYKHGQYPFQKIDHIPAGRFYGDSAIKYLIPLQKEYNKTRSQIIESKNRMGKPQMMYQKGSIDPNMVTSEPGLLIPVQPGMEYPKPVQQPEIPAYVVQEMDRTLRDMDDIVQYEGAKNATPPGVEAASAIAYLQEENDSKLYHTVVSIEEAVSNCGKQTLSLIQQFWDPERIIEVVSKNNTVEAYQFVQGDQITGTDLRVEAGSMAPKSQAARQAFITELMKLGLLPPEKGLRYLQLNETNRLYDEMQAGARMAQRENFKIAQGMINPPQPAPNPMQMGMDPAAALGLGEMDGLELPPPPDGMAPEMGEPTPDGGLGMPSADPTQQPVVDEMGMPIAQLKINSWDDHATHIYEHALFMNSQEFELLPDDRKKTLEDHYLSHQIAANQQMMAGDPNAGGIQPGVPGQQSGNQPGIPAA